MVAFFLGFAVACVFCLLVLTRGQWLDLPRVWRDEPDCRLRGWFRQLRRLTGRGRVARCSGCGGTHFLTTRPSKDDASEGADTWDLLSFGRGPSHRLAAEGVLQWHVERIADDVTALGEEREMLLFFEILSSKTFKAQINDELPEFSVTFSEGFDTANVAWRAGPVSQHIDAGADSYSVAEALVAEYRRYHAASQNGEAS